MLISVPVRVSAAAEPVQVVVRYYDPVAGLKQTVTLEEISRVERVVSPALPWSSVETIEVFATPGGGPEVSVRQIVVSTGHTDGVTPDRFEWIASGDPPVGVDFDRIEVHQKDRPSILGHCGQPRAASRSDLPKFRLNQVSENRRRGRE